MKEYTGLGYPIVLIGVILGLIQSIMMVWVLFETGKFHSFDSIYPVYFILGGLIIVGIDRMLDNQKEIIKLLKEKGTA